jgi:3-dehydroshikimate dehydratase
MSTIMLKLAAFADEISPSLDEQIAVCKMNGVTHFELRSVNKINVLDLDKPLRNDIRDKLRASGLAVACIGSPVGKVKINDSWSAHFDRFKIAVELAEFFSAPLIRIFSYYPPEKGDDIHKYREEVLQRMHAKVDYIKGKPITIVHENEKEIYGEKAAACLDLLKGLNHPQFRCAFDFANFVQAGEHPVNNWAMLRPYVVHFHIKDTKFGGGDKMVPAGEGDGQIEPILVEAYRDGYRGFLTLEPHLLVAGHSHGETGPEMFKVAVDALKAICGRNDIALASP